MTSKRIAIYARVSTTDKGQDPENQLHTLRQWSADSGHTVVQEYIDHESGSKSADHREAFRQMFDDAGKRKFDLVLLWALDRFTREGMAQTVHYLQRLGSFGVGFHSYQEPMLSTQDELTRDILLVVLAALAKAEARRVSNRTKIGLAKAKRKGTKLGRKPIKDKKQQLILTEHATGKSLRAIAKATGIPYSTVRRYAQNA